MTEQPIVFVAKQTTEPRQTPCTICGACCRYFKIEFDIDKNSQVPTNMYQKRSSLWKLLNLRIGNIGIMNGTDKFRQGCCEALDGELGKKSICQIYQTKPNHCGDFPVWMPNGEQNPRCIKAREYYGLPGKITEEELEKAKEFEKTLNNPGSN